MYEIAITEPTELRSEAEEIEQLVREFEDCTLPFNKWTHEAHLKVALWYLCHHSKEEATALIRAGIQRFNLAHGVAMTRERGYHETITMFYIWAISKHLTLRQGGLIAETADELIALYGDKNLPPEYYSRDRLMSWEARTRWIEPDLKPISSWQARS